jgi:hypothetical protein
MGFLKLKGESVIKLRKLSLGTQHSFPLSSSVSDDEDELRATSAIFAVKLLSYFSAEEF